MEGEEGRRALVSSAIEVPSGNHGRRRLLRLGGQLRDRGEVTGTGGARGRKGSGVRHAGHTYGRGHIPTHTKIHPN